MIGCVREILLNRLNDKWITDYNSPTTWSVALMIVVFFVRKVYLPVRLGTTAAFLALPMFGVYLPHETTAFGHELFRVPQSWMAAHLNLPASAVIIISAVMTFFLCVAVDLVRRFMAGLFMSRLRLLSNMKGRGAR